MGGSVIVSKGAGVAMSTLQFVAVAEAVREQFRPEEESLMRDVFSPMDDGGMTFISAIDLAADEFRVFERSVREAFEACKVRGKIPMGEEGWIELISVIEGDPRH